MANKRITNWGVQATKTNLHLKIVIKKEEGQGGKLTEGCKEGARKVKGTKMFSVRDGSEEGIGTRGKDTEGQRRLGGKSNNCNTFISI